jgi:hypothetical protein
MQMVKSKKVAKCLGITIKGKTENIKCPDCVLGKIRIKNFGRKDNETSEKGETINLDISSVKKKGLEKMIIQIIYGVFPFI